MERAALRAARNAWRPARLLRVHRLRRNRRARPRRPRHPGRRSVVPAHSSRSDRGRTRFPRQPRQGFRRRHHARDGAFGRRRTGAGRAQGGGWRLSALRVGETRQRHAAECGAGAAQRRVRRGGRPNAPCTTWNKARRAGDHRLSADRDHGRARQRAGQARRRHRVRAARPHQRSGAQCHRDDPARQPSAPASPRGGAGRQRPRRGGAGRRCRQATARRGLGGSQPQQRLSRAGAQR